MFIATLTELQVPEIKEEKEKTLHYIAYTLTPTNLQQLQDALLPYLGGHKPYAYIGLHTCGNLAWMVIDLFLQSKDAVAMIDIGCCYHAFISGM